MKEQYRTGLFRGVVAAVFAFSLFVLKAGANGEIDTPMLFEAGYVGVIAAAPFFGYGVKDGMGKGRG